MVTTRTVRSPHRMVLGLGCLLLLLAACAENKETTPPTSPDRADSPSTAPVARDPWTDDLAPIPADAWDRDKAAHLLERAGFGGTPEEIDRLAALTPQEAVAELVEFGAVENDLPAFVHSGIFDVIEEPLFCTATEAFRHAEDHGGVYGANVEVDAELPYQTVLDRIYFKRYSNFLEMERVVEWWADRMLNTRRPLEEKLIFFWHDHFATQATKVGDYRKMLAQLELFRGHASGSFRELLRAIVRDPAMIIFLDNQRNAVGTPVENLAREIMELFALGTGHYTEDDVKEAARALTGWTLNPKNELETVFVPERFDADEKTILGKKGKFDADGLVDLILVHEAAAPFLVEKLYEYFVRESPSPVVLAKLSADLREQSYEIEPLLRTLFLSRDFYSATTRAAQIKGPVQLLISTYKKLGLTEIPGNPTFRTTAQNLGQRPGYPPSVAGWDWGSHWINRYTVLERATFARQLLFPGEFPEDESIPVFSTRFSREKKAAGKHAPMRNMEDHGGEAHGGEDPGAMDPHHMESQAEATVKISKTDRKRGFSQPLAKLNGDRQARELVEPRLNPPATLDFATIARRHELSTPESAVNHFAARLLRPDLPRERKEVLVRFLTDRIGPRLSADHPELDDALRELVYLLMCMAEYQMC